jgi:hypothetical protein
MDAILMRLTNIEKSNNEIKSILQAIKKEKYENHMDELFKSGKLITNEPDDNVIKMLEKNGMVDIVDRHILTEYTFVEGNMEFHYTHNDIKYEVYCKCKINTNSDYNLEKITLYAEQI